MPNKAETNITQQKAAAERKLAARIALLKDKGLDERAIARESIVRKIEADIREAKHRLRGIADAQKLTADRAQAKADKLAGKNIAAAAPVSATPPAAKKPKKEKKRKEKPAATS